MTIKHLTSLVLLILVLGLAREARTQELTAEEVGGDGHGHTFKSKVYMGHGKVRIEPQEGTAPGAGAFAKAVLLIDLVGGTSFVLDPDRKIYLEEGPAMAKVNMATFRSPDNTPCMRSPKSTVTADLGIIEDIDTCKHVGTEMINGRNAEKWELVEAIQGQRITAHVWLDARWHFMVKQDNSMGTVGELQDIKEAPQPASLFEIPSDYHKIAAQDYFQK